MITPRPLRFPLSPFLRLPLLLTASTLLAADTNTPITTCASVIQIASAENAETHPVHLRGAITCYVPDAQLCFVQDQSGGVYLYPGSWSGEFKFGEIVEVDGWTGKGKFSPVVFQARLRSTGENVKPAPRRIALEDLNNGQFDSQFVALEGAVQSADFDGGVATLRLWNAGSTVTVLVFASKTSPTNLIDATVHVEGVGGTFYAGERLAGFGVFLQGPDQLQTLKPAVDPSATPLRTSSTLTAYSPDGLDHRVRARGVVTVAWPGEAIFLQDDAGAIRVEAKGEQSVVPGDLVEGCGFVRNITRYPRLSETRLQKIAHKNVPDPHFLPVKDLLAQPLSGQLVATEGFVLNTRALPAVPWTVLEIEGDSQTINAICRQDNLPEVRRGSRIRLTGAWSAPPHRLREQFGAMLWLNSPASILVLAPPRTAASPGLAANSHLWIASTAAALILAVILFAAARRNAARAATLETAASQRQLESERELQRLQDARERLGRDLHDRIIQSIYAIGLNIDECARNAQTNLENVDTRLRAALKDINGVIGELRNVILGLETNAIQPRELRTALKSLALALGHEEANRIRIATDEDALAVLTPNQATELVHIAREALSNSIRHGAASTSSFNLELHDEKIRFTIEDDGRGFDVKAAEGKGFGLRNMAKRATQLEAKFSILSKDGHGTRVVLDIPRQRTHF